MKSISIGPAQTNIQSIGRAELATFLTGIKVFEEKFRKFLLVVIKKTFIYSFWVVLTAPVD